MKKINIKDVGEILQQLYDSEIDFHLGYLWDGGFDYSLENNPYPLGEYKQATVQHTGRDKITEVMQVVVEDVLQQFPDSGFARWWEKYENRDY